MMAFFNLLERSNTVLSDHGWLFVNLAEAQVLIERWRVEYNEQRPHGSLDYRTPLEFAAELEETTGNLESAEGLT